MVSRTLTLFVRVRILRPLPTNSL